MAKKEDKKDDKKETPVNIPEPRRRPFEIAIPYYDQPVDDTADGFFSPQFTRQERRAKFLERRSKRMKPSLKSMQLSSGPDYQMYVDEQQDPPVYSPIRAVNLASFMTDETLANVIVIRRYRDVITSSNDA